MLQGLWFESDCGEMPRSQHHLCEGPIQYVGRRGKHLTSLNVSKDGMSECIILDIILVCKLKMEFTFVPA